MSRIFIGLCLILVLSSVCSKRVLQGTTPTKPAAKADDGKTDNTTDKNAKTDPKKPADTKPAPADPSKTDNKPKTDPKKKADDKPVTPVTPAADKNNTDNKGKDAKPVTPVTPAADNDPIVDLKQLGCIGRPDARCVQCFQNTSICTFCSDGYYPASGRCMVKNPYIKCGTTNQNMCLTCSGDNCGKCLVGFNLHPTGKCIACMVKGCSVCDSPIVCKTCKTGYN